MILMKRTAVLLLCWACLLLDGCSSAQQVENQAFAVALGLDEEEGGVTVTALMPKMQSSSGQTEAGKDADYTLASARGMSFPDALELLSASIPRRLNLTQVKLLVASEALARREDFPELLREIAENHAIYGSSFFAVCQGRVEDFLENQEPVFTPSVNRSLEALLQYHAGRGYIPYTTFSDVFFLANSIYSDPLAILAATSSVNAQDRAAEESPVELLPGQIPVDSDSRNEFAGGALFREGCMVGTLNAREMVLANLIRGGKNSFAMTRDGAGMELQPKAGARVLLETEGDSLHIHYEQTLTVQDLKQPLDLSALQKSLEDEVKDLFTKCQALNVEPFNLAEKAARKFRTIEQWLAYDWRGHFSNAEIDIRLTLEPASI